MLLCQITMDFNAEVCIHKMCMSLLVLLYTFSPYFSDSEFHFILDLLNNFQTKNFDCNLKKI